MAKNLSVYFFVVIITLVGVFLRLHSTFSQPIWVDEQGSLFLAFTNSISDLLLGFSDDVHPGYYYVFLKLVLLYNTKLDTLRFITAVLPQILGIAVMLLVCRKHPSFSLLALAFSLTFNPFFIHLSWQLRMYGIVFFLTCLSYAMFLLWKSGGRTRYLLVLLTSLFIGNTIHYSFLFFSFCFALLLASYSFKKSLRKIVLFAALAGFALMVQFFLLSGAMSKSQFSQASWVEAPTLWNIPNTFLAALGLDDDLHGQSKTFSYQAIFFYLLVVFVLYKYLCTTERSTPSSSNFSRDFFLLVLLPSLLILGVSSLLPFLSHRRYFHYFVPGISIFLPRTILPSAILFFVFLSQFLSSVWKQSKRLIFRSLVVFLLIIVTFRWVYLNWVLNFRLYASIGEQAEVAELLRNSVTAGKPIFIWPPRKWYRAITVDGLDRLQLIEQELARSETLELLVSRLDNVVDQKALCRLVEQSSVYVELHVVHQLVPYQKRTKMALLSCCTEVDKTTFFQAFSCESVD